ncbi:MAG: tRNA pseudouridine(38-40) synthase TruA [Bacilli bacterium]|nr:tRNA pseudouridine(38-40) synthase TruA [Bacilli bacterium]MDD3304820.1 tRNA pseudouridine(38-40) synthase TruA [Bacilli bacterium]MDD4053407.1 tRNA pseudouridine(38-40) synthase TruA [Bacilli bacterium]MDD4410946.1 tRNA pseudouridine(38-40) synthase TruA [Bacilli bacterium]
MSFSYDATNYHGYQKQPKLRTIQQTIEDALTSINGGKTVIIHATSRTDRGVHAINQKAHFDFETNITNFKLKRALNSKLPDDIHVNDVKFVDDNFHARYNAIKKEYVYIINMGEYNPIERNSVFQYNKNLDVEKMKDAIKSFAGEHDFTSFVCAEDLKENNNRIIFEASIKEDGNKLYITFIGTGFLKYQVRNMIGTLIEVGINKREPSSIEFILKSKDRRKAGKTAKPEGLYLKNIWFEDKDL